MLAAAIAVCALCSRLPAFTTDELARLNDPAAPRIIGLVKTLDRPLVVNGTSAWVGEIRAEGATQLRIHLEDIVAGDGAFVRIESADGTTIDVPIPAENTDVWLPATKGSFARIEADPAVIRFRIRETGAIHVDLSPAVASPYLDARCVTSSDFPAIERVRHAVAELTFIRFGTVGHCTGTLIADRAGSGTPYLLTASHCISDNAMAASVQAFFDDDPADCGGTPPDWSTLPTVTGATLVASARASDAALLRLSSVPAGRTFLSVDARPEAVAPGTHVFHLSHPVINGVVLPQVFDESVIDAVEPECVAPGAFVGSMAIRGASGPGSSGAALLTAGGSVVGQILGSCDEPAEEGSTTHPTDGAMSRSWATFAPLLDDAPRRRAARH